MDTEFFGMFSVNGGGILDPFFEMWYFIVDIFDDE
jgi:hypothetical protein